MKSGALFSAAASIALALGLGNGSHASENLPVTISANTALTAGSTIASNPTETVPVPTQATDESKPKVEEKPKVVDEKAEPAKAVDEKAELAKARNALETQATSAKLDMVRLRSRLDEFEKRATASGVSSKQVTDTYNTLTDLLSATTNGPHFDLATRNRLVELVLHNVARPTKIDQGAHPTCNVTTLEVYLAARHPNVYADLVKQVALTGKYVTAKKETVNLPKAAIMPGEDEKNFDMDKPAANKRNHASQLVQMTLINGVYETGRYHSTDRNGKKVDCTGWRYVMGPPVKTYFRVPEGMAFTTDEDRLLDGKGNQVKGSDGKNSTSPIFIGDDVLAASEMVLGYKMPYLDSPYKIENQPWVFDLPTKERLLKYKADGKFPLGVPTMMGNHVQTIHDVFEDANGNFWILIDNQHGEAEDGWITLTELHRTMKDASYELKPRKTKP